MLDQLHNNWKKLYQIFHKDMVYKPLYYTNYNGLYTRAQFSEITQQHYFH
jgi:hypothetical protein